MKLSSISSLDPGLFGGGRGSLMLASIFRHEYIDPRDTFCFRGRLHKKCGPLQTTDMTSMETNRGRKENSRNKQRSGCKSHGIKTRMVFQLMQKTMEYVGISGAIPDKTWARAYTCLYTNYPRIEKRKLRFIERQPRVHFGNTVIITTFFFYIFFHEERSTT